MKSESQAERPLQRLKRKLGVETLWIFILSLLSRKDSYAYELIKSISDEFGFDPGRVLPYIVLKRLEMNGYVKSYTSGNRKYYKLTDKGRSLLERGVEYIERTLERLKSG